MQTTEALKQRLKENLLQRGLRPLRGRLAFAHRGEIVEVTIDESVYRGRFIGVQERGRAVREFRLHGGDYDWAGIAATVVNVAEARLALRDPNPRNVPADGAGATSANLARDLRAMLGPRASPLSIEPSPGTPGHVKVKLNEVELDPIAVLQLFAALARARPGDAAAL